MNNPGARGGGNRGAAAAGNRGQTASAPAAPATPAAPPAAAGNGGDGARRGAGARGGGSGNVQFAEAAAWSPNPNNPPNFFDLPAKDGQLQPLIAAKWVANSPLAMIISMSAI